MKGRTGRLHPCPAAARAVCHISDMASDGGIGARHEFTPHTSELALRLHAPSVSALLAEACVALGTLLVEEAGDAGQAAARTLDLSSVDADALLVDLLNELLYLAETERWAPGAAAIERWHGGDLVVRIEGTALAGVPSRIKSATHHGLHLRQTAAGVEAEVVFDV